ncbi:MAG: choice-of-anchor J domain-containing protein [Bacteroidales bacterium]|nr:choice-of-anchor J domain-containing protein [Bacteroidales bacterium]
MKPGSIGWLSLLFLILLGSVGHVSSQEAASLLVPAPLSGTVTNAITGVPIIGAKITVNSQSVWSVYGGTYFMKVEPVGTFTVTYGKQGFDTYTSQPVAFQAGIPVIMNITLWENLNPPYLASSSLDTASQTVNINWQLPRGNYERLYDDGIREHFTVWAFQGNMNAVRFSPIASPVSLKGGSVHLGDSTNYPSGSSPLVPFQVAVYKADGDLGMPGSQIAGPFDVIPTKFGWNEFTFPSPVTLPGGDFYLVMIQGGNAPNAAGLAIDNTATQLRSVSRFITGSAPWMPASGNFMMRAVLYGPGGPLDADSLSESLLQYQVYRLRQGEEQNPSVWVDLGTTTDLFDQDPGWFNLPCGPYRWGIRALYSGSRTSQAKFSNILGKCWTVGATIQVELSCVEASSAGAFIRLKNLVYPDTVYTFTVDTSGMHTFPQVWKGTYELSVRKFGYQDFTGNISLAFDTTVSLLLLQKKPPPTNLLVDAKTLVAQWHVPTYTDTLFTECWSSGSFFTNSWNLQGGTNWIVSSVIGNPAPSAMFSWSPQVVNYEQTLTSKSISGLHSPILTCSYDIYLDNFGTTTLNQMAVEIWDGSSWATLKNYSNATGGFPWITDQVDISSATDLDFKIRFRAYGEDSYDINGWNIDNINVSASETNAGLLNCILGYNFYLNNVLVGFTTDTKYIIPGTLVQYGQSYEACVLAAYGSGHSPKACTQFTSAFLYPPRNLTANAIENNVYLQWLKPKIPDSATPPGLLGYRIYRNNALIRTISDPDSLNYYDFNLEPGTYSYEVTARYDLSAYGFPGQFDESMPSGPVTIILNFGRELPFYEPWDQASFSFNEWKFEPAPGNWVIDMDQGSPFPSARFSWEPLRTSYSYGMTTPVLNATPYECARIWLEFDLKLEDRYGTGLEKLCIEIYYNNIWHKMTEYLNGGSISWQTKKIDISAVAGQAFRVRFRASGVNSTDILGWFVDNIYIYSVCYPARNLEGDVVGNDVLLTWSPPNCEGTGGHLSEGFEGTLFPPSGWDMLITNAASTWSHTAATSTLGVHAGNYSAGIYWDYSHQDEWLIVRDIAVTGNLTFWSHAFQGSSHLDHYYVKISPDGGTSWDVLLDMSTLPNYPSFNGYNLWQTPYEIDMTTYLGQTVDLAWQAVDGDDQGLWYSWAIDDCFIGTDAINLSTYDIFRRTGSSGDFEKITVVPLSDTTYLDEDLSPAGYQYYILALSPGCLQSETSDTVTIDVITSSREMTGSQPIRIYPNPATDKLFIESTTPIESYTLFTSSGRMILSERDNPGFIPTNFQILQTETIPSGLYLLSITTFRNTSCYKVVISH